MEKYWQIEKVNLKHNTALHILVCAVILGLSPLLIGVSNLGWKDTAKTLEMYTAFIGIIMLTPIFLPEQDKEIRDVTASKYMDCAKVYFVRLLGNSIILAVFLSLYIAMLKHNRCEFPMVWYFLGTYVEMLFLGGLGLFFYGLCDNLVIGYMIPIMYYIFALGGGSKYLKLFYPFSMVSGSYREKYVLAVSALLLLAGAIALRRRRR